jgi:hypothetical protein
MTWYNPLSWFGNNEHDSYLQECDHGFPKPENEHWYTYLERRPREYWADRDAVFVKLESVHRLMVCEYCGQMKHMSTAEKVGGVDGIIRKKDYGDGVVGPPEPRPKSGAYKKTKRNEKNTLFEAVQEFEQAVESELEHTEPETHK